MLTNFGKILRKVRIDHGKTLGDLGASIELSAAFISALETGKRPVPESFVDKVQVALNLTSTEAHELRRAAASQANEVRLDLVGKSDRAKEMVVAFARRFDSMTESEIAQLLGKGAK